MPPTVTRLAIPALTVLLAACDSSGVDGPAGPVPDEIVDGVNLTDLFAAPRNNERDTVRAEWAARDADRDDRYGYLLLPPVRAADGSDLIVYTGSLPGPGDVVHHGVVRLPPREPGDTERRPVVLVLPEDGPSVDVAGALDNVPLESPVLDEVVFVIMAYRGQTLQVEGIDFTSPADSSAPYDLDTDDALALLSEVLGREPLADPDRVAVIGYDRGGSAALASAERSGTIDFIVSLAAPTDFFLPSVRQMARAYLLGQSTGTFPAFDDVAATALDPLRGGGGDLAAARLALLRRSPAYFAGPPPFIYAAHGTLDFVVPVAHGRALRDVTGTPEAVYSEYMEHDHDSLPNGPDVMARATVLFIEKVVKAP
jgi:hypothetical protein